MWSERKRREHTNHVPLFLGLGGTIGPRGNPFGLVGLAVGLCLCDFTGGSLAAPSSCPSLCPSFIPLLVFLFRGLGDFDDESTTIELLFIQSGDGLFSSLEGREGYKAIAGRTSATLYNLSGETVGEIRKVEFQLERATYISVAAVSKKARRPWSVVE